MLSVPSVSYFLSNNSIICHFPSSDLEWDFEDLIFEPESISSSPISTESNRNSPDSAETYQNPPASVESNGNSPDSNHGSIFSTEPVDLGDRKRKRMKSNRESARRSRMRKQHHVDNLRNQANRLHSMNRDLSNRLRFILHNGQIVRSENERLQTDHSLLRHRLIELQNLMIFQGIQQMNNQNYNNISSNYRRFGAYGHALINESTHLIA